MILHLLAMPCRAVPCLVTPSGTVRNAHMAFIETPATPAESCSRQSTDGDGAGKGDVEEPVKGDAQAASAQSVTFLFRLVVGQAHQSYGLNVARAAGMDSDVVALAARKSTEMRER